MEHLGFYNTSTSRTHVRFQFPTNEAAGGNVAPSSAFEAADIRIYRAADSAAFSPTQRSSSNGITMTSPFGSLVGVHDVDIDLTDNSDSGFYASGYKYSVLLCPDETIDGQTITGIPLVCFEIGVAPANLVQWQGDGQTATDGKDFFDAGYDPSTNRVNADAVAISGDTDAADKLAAQFERVVYVNHDGNDGTSGTALAAAIEGNAKTVVYVSPGVYTMSSGLGPAEGVRVIGCGIETTVLEWAGSGGGDIDLVANCAFEKLTLRETGSAVLFYAGGSVALNDLALRDVFLDSADIEPIDLGSTSACTLTLERVRMRANFEWGMSFGLAAHTIYANDVDVIVTGNASTTDSKCFRLNNGSMLFGNNIRLLTTADADAGKAIQVIGASSAILANCSFGNGEIHVANNTGFIRLTNCEFNRSNVTFAGGATSANVVDIMSPVMPGVAFRKLGVESDGDLTKVNSLDGHTPQTGDNFARLGAPVGGSLSVDLQNEFASINTVLGPPSTSIAGDIEAVSLKLGTPSTSIAGDIAGIEASVDAIAPTGGRRAAGEGNTAKNLDQVEGGGGGGTLTDVDQEPVGDDRLILLEPDDDMGLVAEKAKAFAVGAEPTFAVDFRKNMAVNSWITNVSEPMIVDGTEGGITFSNMGRDKSLAKFRAEGVTAGTYRVRVDVTYYGGGTATGFITLKVVE